MGEYSLEISLRELGFEPDRIGLWSEIKLELIKRYAKEYSRILHDQKYLSHAYVDGFSGGGIHLSKESGAIKKGSPLIALEIDPPFDNYYFIDLNTEKTDFLQSNVGNMPNVEVFNGDCNEILSKRIFPLVRKQDSRRALCILDPYGIHYKWDIVEMAGQMESVELFLNFSIMDINRTVVRDRLSDVHEKEMLRMNLFWGDTTWQDYMYREGSDLFGLSRKERFMRAHKVLPSAYRQRLIEKAGFKYVPEPVPFVNTKGGLLYYLYFASHNQVAYRIVKYIFDNFGRG